MLEWVADLLWRTGTEVGVERRDVRRALVAGVVVAAVGAALYVAVWV